MNIEGPHVKGVPEAVRKQPRTQQSSLFKSSTSMYAKQSTAATRRNAFTTNGDLAWFTSGST